MATMNITLSFNLDDGEAGVTRRSGIMLDELLEANPLLAADCLLDVVNELNCYYARAHKAAFPKIYEPAAPAAKESGE